jgi:hypothetical protein
MSATPDSTLANPEQLIADLQRQLAEREAELAEAREQQTATAEVLQVINSSPGDLGPGFDAMLDKALRLCEAAFGFLATYDGERFHHTSGRSLPPAFADLLREPRLPGVGTAGCEWFAARHSSTLPICRRMKAHATGLRCGRRLSRWLVPVHS